MIGVCIAVFGSIVMLGWSMEIAWLLNLRPDAVTMKFVTAASFVVAGLCTSLQRRSDPLSSHIREGMAVCLGLVQVALLLMGPVVEFETEGAILSPVPNMPSLATVGCFLLLSGAVIHEEARDTLAKTIAIISGVALLGHVLALPRMQWYYPEVSTAMAIHTAMCFLVMAWDLRRSP